MYFVERGILATMTNRRENSLRIRVASGDLDAAYELAMGLLWGSFGTPPDHEMIQEGVALLVRAFESGHAYAGYELATLSTPFVEIGDLKMSSDEKFEIILNTALTGNHAAALEIYHRYFERVDRATMRKIMTLAAGTGSVTAADILKSLPLQNGH